MGFHHVAVATRDAEATHAFYTGPMGFRLVKVVAGRTDGGFSKHLFYDTGGGGLFAVWELHDTTLPEDWKTAISTGLGLPVWTNHIAFDAAGLADIESRKKRLLDHGVGVAEVDHGWCTSIYAQDPNGIMVEFCATTRAFTAEDAAEAERLRRDPDPPLEPLPTPRLHRPAKT